MFWFSFEWVWEIGHLIFMGGLWYALGIVGLGMAYAIIKSVIDTMNGEGSHHH